MSHEQLIAAGLSPGVIRRLVRKGFLHRLYRGVYAVGHLALPAFGAEQAALLACGDRALIDGRSALHLWGLHEVAPTDVEVTLIGRQCRKRPGIRLHLARAIDDRDVRRRHGLAVTSPARAVITFSAEATDRELEDVIAEARVKRLIREGELEATSQRAGRTRGAARVRAFLRDEDGSGITRSHAERHFRKLLRQARLPEPKTNVYVARHEADFFWPDERVILEVDSWQFHGHRRAFEKDRKKDMIWSDAGYLVIRVTWRQFTEEALWLVAHIARALDRRGRTAG